MSRTCEDCDAEPVAGFTRCSFHLERGPEQALVTDAEIYAKMVSGKVDHVLATYAYALGVSGPGQHLPDAAARARADLRAAVEDLKIAILRAQERDIEIPQRTLIQAAMAMFVAGATLGSFTAVPS